jgi:hypothetical protein
MLVINEFNSEKIVHACWAKWVGRTQPCWAEVRSCAFASCVRLQGPDGLLPLLADKNLITLCGSLEKGTEAHGGGAKKKIDRLARCPRFAFCGIKQAARQRSPVLLARFILG